MTQSPHKRVFHLNFMTSDILLGGFGKCSRGLRTFQAGICLLKVNNRNSRKRYEICSNLKLKTQNNVRHRYGVFVVNFEHISRLAPVFLLLTLNILFSARLVIYLYICLSISHKQDDCKLTTWRSGVILSSYLFEF